MIESHYWRVELKADLVWLKRHRKYLRWSEKRLVLYERKLMLVAFQVRSLLEHLKVNDSARSTVMQIQRYKKIGNLPFTATGSGWPDERFDMKNPESAVLPAIDVCNQLIHNYWMQTLSEGKAFAAMLVFSDYKRHKWAYLFQVDDLLALFQVFSDHSSSVRGTESQWDEKKQDYVVKKSCGFSESLANHSLQWSLNSTIKEQ